MAVARRNKSKRVGVSNPRVVSLVLPKKVSRKAKSSIVLKNPQPQGRTANMDVFRDFQNTIRIALNNPTVVLMLALAVVFYIDHSGGKGVLTSYCNSKDHSACVWFKANTNKFMGMVLVFPALWDLPRNLFMMTTLVAYAGIYLLAAQSMIVYAAFGLAVHTYFRSRVSTTRYLIIGMVLLAYLATNTK